MWKAEQMHSVLLQRADEASADRQRGREVKLG